MRLRLPTTIAGQAKLGSRPQPPNRVVVQHGAANALAEARLATEPGTPVVLVPVRGRAKDRRGRRIRAPHPPLFEGRR